MLSNLSVPSWLTKRGIYVCSRRSPRKGSLLRSWSLSCTEPTTSRKSLAPRCHRTACCWIWVGHLAAVKCQFPAWFYVFSVSQVKEEWQSASGREHRSWEECLSMNSNTCGFFLSSREDFNASIGGWIVAAADRWWRQLGFRGFLLLCSRGDWSVSCVSQPSGLEGRHKGSRTKHILGEEDDQTESNNPRLGGSWWMLGKAF